VAIIQVQTYPFLQRARRNEKGLDMNYCIGLELENKKHPRQMQADQNLFGSWSSYHSHWQATQGRKESSADILLLAVEEIEEEVLRQDCCSENKQQQKKEELNNSQG